MTNQSSSNLKNWNDLYGFHLLHFWLLQTSTLLWKDQVQLAFDLKTLYPGWENFFTTCKWRILLCIFLFHFYFRHDNQENWL